MSGGNRGIVIALAGIAALSTAYGLGLMQGASDNAQEQRYQPYRYASDKPPEADPSLPAVSGAKSFGYRRPCENQEGPGESDLCAQWNAANAAEDSAWWTKWSVWVGVAGSCFLLWQIILTRKAVEDTSEATDAMREANKIAGTGIRAWLSIDLEEAISCSKHASHEHGPGYRFIVSATIKNHGTAPATDIRFDAEIVPTRFGDPIVRPMSRYCDEGRTRFEAPEYEGGFALFLGQGEPFDIEVFLADAAIEKWATEANSRFVAPRVHGFVSYRSSHVDGLRQTRFSIAIGKEGQPINLNEPEWWTDGIELLGPIYIQAD